MKDAVAGDHEVAEHRDGRADVTRRAVELDGGRGGHVGRVGSNTAPKAPSTEIGTRIPRIFPSPYLAEVKTGRRLKSRRVARAPVSSPDTRGRAR